MRGTKCSNLSGPTVHFLYCGLGELKINFSSRLAVVPLMHEAIFYSIMQNSGTEPYLFQNTKRSSLQSNPVKQPRSLQAPTEEVR